MKISARNQWEGKVISVKSDNISAEINIELEHGEILTTVITKNSCDKLNLDNGKEVISIIKAPWVVLAEVDDNLHFSARNQFKGKITKIVNGAVNSIVYIKTDKELPLTSIITNESCDEMNLFEGKAILALIKASSIILATRLN